jgi:hypothetical protein
MSEPDSERRHPCLRATGILPVKRRAGCARPADKDVGVPIHDSPFTIRSAGIPACGPPASCRETARRMRATRDKDVGAPIHDSPFTIYHVSREVFHNAIKDFVDGYRSLLLRPLR